MDKKIQQELDLIDSNQFTDRRFNYILEYLVRGVVGDYLIKRVEQEGFSPVQTQFNLTEGGQNGIVVTNLGSIKEIFIPSLYHKRQSLDIFSRDDGNGLQRVNMENMGSLWDLYDHITRKSSKLYCLENQPTFRESCKTYSHQLIQAQVARLNDEQFLNLLRPKDGETKGLDARAVELMKSLATEYLSKMEEKKL